MGSVCVFSRGVMSTTAEEDSRITKIAAQLVSIGYKDYYFFDTDDNGNACLEIVNLLKSHNIGIRVTMLTEYQHSDCVKPYGVDECIVLSDCGMGVRGVDNRYRWLIDKCDCVLCYDRAGGKLPDAIKYAISRGRSVVMI